MGKEVLPDHCVEGYHNGITCGNEDTCQLCAKLEVGNVVKNDRSFRVYDVKEIQKVYHQHAYYCGTVLYSEDGGYTWKSVGMDSGKWYIHDWLFAFISLT